MGAENSIFPSGRSFRNDLLKILIIGGTAGSALGGGLIWLTDGVGPSEKIPQFLPAGSADIAPSEEELLISYRVDAAFNEDDPVTEMIIRLGIDDPESIDPLINLLTKDRARAIVGQYVNTIEKNEQLWQIIIDNSVSIESLNRVVRRVLSKKDFKTDEYPLFDIHAIKKNLVIGYWSEPGGGLSWEDPRRPTVLIGPYTIEGFSRLNEEYVRVVIAKNLAHETVVHKLQGLIKTEKSSFAKDDTGRIIHSFMGGWEDIAMQAQGFSFLHPDTKMLVAMDRAQKGGLTEEKVAILSLRIGAGKINDITTIASAYKKGKGKNDPSFIDLMRITEEQRVPRDSDDEFYAKKINRYRAIWDRLAGVPFSKY